MMGMAVKPDVKRAPRKCRGKKRYPNAERAGEMMVRLSERIAAGIVKPHPVDRPLEVYRCDWCDKWHFGHRPERAR